MVDRSIVKIQYPVTFENETPTAINKLVVMSKKQAPRSSVWINEAGLDKICDRMAKLKKPDNDNKRGKSCWTVEYLAQQAYVSQSTIKRLLNKKVPIDQTSAISILDKLGFESSSFIDEHDQMLKNYNQNQPLSSEVDWQKVCLEMLQEQQEDQQIRRKATEMGFEVKVYVPLGLVERKQQQRRSGIINTEQIHQLDQEVITQIYKHQEFLDDIIGQQPTDQDQHIAIIGEPGAGKTTLLDRIATYIKDENQDLFIYISLANLQGRSIKTYILNEWLPKAISLSYPELDPESLEKTFQHRLNQGGVWLLLDGADEGTLSLAEIQTEISNFVKIRVVLTCRTNVWDIYVNNPLTRFKTYKTQEFKPEQIDQFIQGWFEQAQDEIRGKELQAKLKESQRDRIRQLVTNPLRLALLCQIFYKDKNAELPETKAGLYEQFVRYFYEWKPAITGIDWGTKPQLQDELHQGLGKLAIAGLDSNYRYRLPLSLIKTEIDDELFKLAWDLGWLTLVDREEDTDEAVYAFYHSTFQEYFAALAVNNWDFFLNHNNENPNPFKKYKNKDCCYKIFEAHWKEVILLWFGSNHINRDMKELFINELINFTEGNDHVESYRFQSYLLAALGASEMINSRFLERFINTLLEVRLGNYYTELNKRVVMVPKFVFMTISETLKLINSNYLVPIIESKLDLISDDFGQLLLAKLLIDINPNNATAINTLIDLTKKGNDEIKITAYSDLLQNNYFDQELNLEMIKLSETELNTVNKSNLIEAFIYNGISQEFDLRINPKNKITSSISYVKFLLDYDILIEFNNIDESYISKLRNDLLFAKDTPIFERELDCILQADVLGTLVPGDSLAIKILTDFIYEKRLDFIHDLVAKALGKIGYQQVEAIEALNFLIESSEDIETKIQAAASLGRIDFDNSPSINTLFQILHNSPNLLILEEAFESLKIVLLPNMFLTTIKNLKVYVTSEEKEKNYLNYSGCYEIVWHCAQHISYPEFYHAWHEPDTTKEQLETSYNNLTEILKQLQPTDQVYPILIDGKYSLENLTDESAIAQEFCNKIYEAIFPDDDIPTVKNAPELKRLFPKFKRQLNILTLVFIIYNIEPYPELINVCRQLLGKFHIAFITDQEIEPDLRGFPMQNHLVNILQNWLTEISYKETL